MAIDRRVVQEYVRRLVLPWVYEQLNRRGIQSNDPRLLDYIESLIRYRTRQMLEPAIPKTALPAGEGIAFQSEDITDIDVDGILECGLLATENREYIAADYPLEIFTGDKLAAYAAMVFPDDYPYHFLVGEWTDTIPEVGNDGTYHSSPMQTYDPPSARYVSQVYVAETDGDWLLDSTGFVVPVISRFTGRMRLMVQSMLGAGYDPNELVPDTWDPWVLVPEQDGILLDVTDYSYWIVRTNSQGIRAQKLKPRIAIENICQELVAGVTDPLDHIRLESIIMSQQEIDESETERLLAGPTPMQNGPYRAGYVSIAPTFEWNYSRGTLNECVYTVQRWNPNANPATPSSQYFFIEIHRVDFTFMGGVPTAQIVLQNSGIVGFAHFDDMFYRPTGQAGQYEALWYPINQGFTWYAQGTQVIYVFYGQTGQIQLEYEGIHSSGTGNNPPDKLCLCGNGLKADAGVEAWSGSRLGGFRMIGATASAKSPHGGFIFSYQRRMEAAGGGTTEWEEIPWNGFAPNAAPEWDNTVAAPCADAERPYATRTIRAQYRTASFIDAEIQSFSEFGTTGARFAIISEDNPEAVYVIGGRTATSFTKRVTTRFYSGSEQLITGINMDWADPEEPDPPGTPIEDETGMRNVVISAYHSGLRTCGIYNLYGYYSGLNDETFVDSGGGPLYTFEGNIVTPHGATSFTAHWPNWASLSEVSDQDHTKGLLITVSESYGGIKWYNQDPSTKINDNGWDDIVRTGFPRQWFLGWV